MYPIGFIGCPAAASAGTRNGTSFTGVGVARHEKKHANVIALGENMCDFVTCVIIACGNHRCGNSRKTALVAMARASPLSEATITLPIDSYRHDNVGNTSSNPHGYLSREHVFSWPHLVCCNIFQVGTRGAQPLALFGRLATSPHSFHMLRPRVSV